MGKKARVKNRSVEAVTGAVGPRQPCPCGSGRRYKACHGAAGGAGAAYVARPFAGLAGEGDLIALREFVPAATVEVAVKGHEDRKVVLCSLLPGAAPGLVRPDGTVWIGMQVQHAYRDPSRDLAAALEIALTGEPGDDVVLVADPGDGPRLQDLLVEQPLTLTMHTGFDYWLEGVDDPDGSLAGVLEQANGVISPTLRLTAVEAAYWSDMGDKVHLRWAMTYDEDALLDALARLHAAESDTLVPGGRLVGMFRAHGLLVPVWDLPAGTGAEALEEPAAAYLVALEAALADDSPLSPDERSTRAGLANRQVTLR